jgi:ligand-binding sensor domain-containing protein
VYFKNKFIAVGTNGQIDLIQKSGEKTQIKSNCSEKLNCAFADEDKLLIAGNNGTILFSTDGKTFRKAESGTSKNIYSIASKNELMVVGSDNGSILTSKNGLDWRISSTTAKGNIISISANNSIFIGITGEGEIIKSTDGINWEIQDYNKEYAEYYKYSRFNKIMATQNSIIIVGVHDDGSPSILLSNLGNVWSERIPAFQAEDGVLYYLTQEPKGIAYDAEHDEYFLACNKGELLKLPGCSKCNKYMKISETNLNALFYLDDCLFIVGDNFSLFIQRL